MSGQVIRIHYGSTGITIKITIHPYPTIQNVDEAPLSKFEVCGMQNGVEKSLATTEIIGDFFKFSGAPANGNGKKKLTKSQCQKRNHRINEKGRLKR